MALNIIHIGKYYYPFQGGIETVVKDLCEGFSQKGHNTRVLCSSETNRTTQENINGVEVYRYAQLSKLNSLPISPKMWLSIRAHSKWADIIHIHSPNPICEIMSLFIPSSKVIVTTHHSDIYRQKIFKLILKPFWFLFKNKVTRFIVPTPNHITYSDMINDQKKKSEIIPFSIKEESLKTTPSKFLEEKKLDQYILFVGRLVEYKGIKYLISAMKNIQSHLIIAGSGPESNKLQSQVIELGIQDRVHFTGRVEETSELYALYERAYCFVLPSVTKNENFGMVQLEAMSFARPIITTNIQSGVPAVGIPNKTTLLVSPRSSEELAIAIKKLLDNPKQAKDMGIAGRELFLEKYTYKKMIHSHIELYQRLLNEKK